MPVSEDVSSGCAHNVQNQADLQYYRIPKKEELTLGNIASIRNQKTKQGLMTPF